MLHGSHTNQVTMHDKPHHLSFLLFLLILCGLARGRFIAYRPSSSSSDLISDGVQTYPTFTTNNTSYRRLHPLFSTADESCESTYGFLPCTTSVLGNLFFILVYGSLSLLATTYLSNGSDILLEIWGPGIFGGLFLPILDMFPDTILILVSGIGVTVETAQSKVSVGMGVLAGYTVLFLTVIWGSCVVFGKCDLEGRDPKAIDGQNTKGFHLTGSGVSTDIWTCYAARIMAISVIPFIVVQLPQLLTSTSGSHLALLIAFIMSLLMLVSYFLYQVFQPKIQRRRIAYAKHKHVISGILKHLNKHALGRLLTDDGELNKEVIKKLFEAIDENHDEKLSYSELKALIIGIRFEEVDLNKDDAVKKLLQDFDTSNDDLVDMNEFMNGIQKWLNVASQAGAISPESGPRTQKYIDDFHQQTKREHDLLGAEVQSDENVVEVENMRWTVFKAVMTLIFATVIAAVLANPLVDAIHNLSDATSIPSFYISFIASPLATHSSDAVSMIITASSKEIRTASLTFSELYGAVAMNNVLCLSVLLAIVYFRGLTWNFSSEVLVVLIVCIVMGVFVSFHTTFPLWTCSVAFILYPFSLALVYVLDYVLGWS